MPNLTQDRERRLRGAAAHPEAAGTGGTVPSQLTAHVRWDDLEAFEVLSFLLMRLQRLPSLPALTPGAVDMAVWVAFSPEVFLNTAGVAIPQCSPVLLYN